MDAVEALKVVWMIGWPVATLLGSWVISRAKASKQEIDDLRDRVDKGERVVAEIQAEIRHLPDRDQTHRMELSLGEMKGELAVLSERLGPVSAIADRLQEYLLEDARRHRGVA